MERAAVCTVFKTLMRRLKPVVYTTQWKIKIHGRCLAELVAD
jgi:hypothetical protein